MISYPGQYAPFVLSGRNRSPSRTASPSPFYRLVGVTENPHEVNGNCLSSGSVYLIQPGQDLTIRLPRQDTGLSIDFTVIASPLNKTPHSQAFEISPQAPPQPPAEEVWGVTLPTVLSEPLWSWTQARLRLITSTWWRGNHEHFQANMRLTEILERFVASAFKGDDLREAPAHNWFFSVERAVEERIHSLKTVEDLAGIAGMSTAHFSRRFREVVQQPPAAWLRQRRLDAAALLLRTSASSIQDIALQVGFRRASAFNLAWRREFGCTPGEWKNRRLST